MKAASPSVRVRPTVKAPETVWPFTSQPAPKSTLTIPALDATSAQRIRRP